MLQTMLHKANALPPVLSSSSMQLPMQHDLATMNMLAGSAIPMPVPAPQLVSPVVLASNFPSTGQDIDLRNVTDPRMGGRNMDQDMRNINMAVPGPIMNPFDAVPQRNQMQQRPNLQQQQQQQQPTFQSDPRQRPVDPRVKQHQQQQQQQPPVVPQQMPIHLPTQQQQQQILSASQNRLPAGGIPNNASDQEKAALIMQVLQLSDDQISMLPPEQRASILVLKEQIAKSTQR